MPDFLSALETEIGERASYLDGESLETIYFGGGTPSLIPLGGLQRIFEKITENFIRGLGCEITIEANHGRPQPQLSGGIASFIPRKQVGVGKQSFQDHDLKLLNRRHNAKQALQCIEDAKNTGFANITIDLIYGLPDLDLPAWRSNLEIAFSLDIQHLSAYHLTIEPNTAMARMTSRGLIHLPEEGESAEQFLLLNKLARENGFEHYEISNLAKKDTGRSTTAITGSKRNILAWGRLPIHSIWFRGNGM